MEHNLKVKSQMLTRERWLDHSSEREKEKQRGLPRGFVIPVNGPSFTMCGKLREKPPHRKTSFRHGGTHNPVTSGLGAHQI